ncbi:Retrotrans gag domain-containing protein [Abeliophyllum distichum]|uniref:Retrotrans gag domain-containing protein n=1 Tax=Abeliophyllum distichum TaxID=126358 RepID=A0ABD1QJH2_9LAMI
MMTRISHSQTESGMHQSHTNFVCPKSLLTQAKEILWTMSTHTKLEMSLRGATPALKCRAFHLTLSGGAKRWYNKLVAGSISSWPELKRTFINYFSSGKPASAPVQRLHDIRQAESEPLQSYLSRFNEEMLFCERITDAEALSALKGGLDMNSPFLERRSQQKPHHI